MQGQPSQKQRKAKGKEVASQPHEGPKQRTGEHEGGLTRGSDIDREGRYVFNLHEKGKMLGRTEKKKEKKIHTS